VTGYGAVMATVLLFHHAHGQTPGFLTFADDLRAAGHTVHTPDLYDGRTFGDLREGVAYAEQVGFPEIIRRGSDAAKDLPADIVYAGFSLGVLPAQALAQTRPGASLPWVRVALRVRDLVARGRPSPDPYDGR
jgi:hypothetical protein